MDVFGVCILGLTTAVGGGVIRDLLLGITPPGTFQDPIYAVVALLTSPGAVSAPHPAAPHGDQRLYDLVLLIMDSAGLGIFTVAGIRIAYEHAARPTLFLLVFVGVVTGVGGGVLQGRAGRGHALHFRQACLCLRLPGRGAGLRGPLAPGGRDGRHALRQCACGRRPHPLRPLPLEPASRP